MNSRIDFRAISMVLCLLSSTMIFASPNGKTDTSSNDKIPKCQRFQWTLSLQPVTYNAARTRYFGEDYVQSNRTFSGVIGAGLNLNINQKYAIGIGVDATVIPFNIRYDFESGTSNPFLPQTQHEYNTTVYHARAVGAHISATRRFNLIDRIGYSPTITAGVKFNSLSGFGYSDEKGYAGPYDSYHGFFVYEMKNKGGYEENGQYASMFLKMGLWKMNEKQNTFQVSAVINYTPSTIMEGSYSFHQLPKQTEGKLELGGNYVGLDFSFGFGMMTAKSRKDCATEKF